MLILVQSLSVKLMNKSKILIVDDRKFDRILYKEYLGDDLFLFEELSNGLKIIETLDAFKPDVILLDWQMPVIGGKETLQEIRKHLRFNKIPIIVITGVSNPMELQIILEFDNVDFLSKPVNQIEINTRIKNTLKYSHHLASVASL